MRRVEQKLVEDSRFDARKLDLARGNGRGVEQRREADRSDRDGRVARFLGIRIVFEHSANDEEQLARIERFAEHDVAARGELVRRSAAVLLGDDHDDRGIRRFQRSKRVHGAARRNGDVDDRDVPSGAQPLRGQSRLAIDAEDAVVAVRNEQPAEQRAQLRVVRDQQDARGQ